MALSLVHASENGLQIAEDFLVVFDGYFKPVMALLALALTIQFIWVGMGMALGSNYRLQELILKMRKVWLAVILANACFGLEENFPPLHQIGRNIRDSIIEDIAYSYNLDFSSVYSRINAVTSDLKSEENGLNDNEVEKIKEEAANHLIVDDTVCGKNECPSLVGVVNRHIKIDLIFSLGIALAIVAMIIFTAASVAAGLMSFMALGFGAPFIGMGLIATLLPLVMGIIGFGLMLMGWSLALTLTFFMLDLQLRILTHLAPIFILGYAFDSTKSYAEAWTKSLIKNVFGSIFMVLFSFLAAKVIATAGGSAGAFFFGLVLFFAVSRYAHQLAADLVGGMAAPSEDLGSSGQSAKAAGQQLEQGFGSGAGVASQGQRITGALSYVAEQKQGKRSDFGQIRNPGSDVSAFANQDPPSEPTSPNDRPVTKAKHTKK